MEVMHMATKKLLSALSLTALVTAGGALWVSPEVRTALSAMLDPAERHAASKAWVKGHGHNGHKHGPGEQHGAEGEIMLTGEQIEKAKIELATAGNGSLARRLTVPGTVTPDSDRIGRVAAKVVGTVAELRKRLGDSVTKGEVIAVLESREVADAKSDYLAALVQFDLQKTLFDREQTLWDKRIISEQQFLRSRTAFTEAQLRLNVARQKLAALDLSETEVEALPNQPITALRQKELRAPLSGQIVERRVDLGAPVGGEGHEKELYVIADLAWVWVELSVPASELASVEEGYLVSIRTSANNADANGKVIFISPLLHPETRTARVIAGVENPAMTLRPGTFVTAQIAVEEQDVELRIPLSALQTIGSEQVAFVRTDKGFEKREVVLGRRDDAYAEVVFGLDAGETIAVANTFVLKAELGKSEAEHGHAH
jgi:cobalt-zinc-cadmium efflux system membrane fusion protein